MTDAPAIACSNLSKRYGEGEEAESVLESVSFEVGDGNFVALIGRSGSGKSTLLDVISGIERPDGGGVTFPAADGEATVGHVFQAPRLLPWETCLQNVEYVHGDDPEYDDDVGRRYLDLVGLGDQYDQYPTQLSGGQRQRVGLARALSVDPDVLLMDEPFSNVDEITADGLREDLLDLWADFSPTVVFVTHDVTEAVRLADRVLMLGDGDLFGDVTVPLDRPRSVDSVEFVRFRERVREQFREQG